jgi:hypothetical protein
MLEAVSDALRESFFTRSSAGKLVALLLGFVASILLLTRGDDANFKLVAVVFSAALILTMLLFIAVRAQETPYRFRWGLPVFVFLGFGLCATVYQYRSSVRWLWDRILRINEPYEWALAALFLIGVILGAFIVRIWPKDQDAFIKGLSGILGGTFVAAIFVKMFEDAPQMPQRAFALYALGFAISGTINLIGAAWLTANYTNNGSIRSRAVLDFLYGSERAETIDKYFLKNFEEDPDYAKRWLTNTLLEFSKLVQNEFAERMENRRQIRSKGRHKLHFYELRSFVHESKDKADESSHESQTKRRKYKITYRRLGDTERQTVSETSADLGHVIQPDMFRVAISIKQAELLEYIVAPGEYQASFPLVGSVAGLALSMRETIVMDRDRDREFRDKDHKDGISPGKIEQYRGLDEIDFLSYISIPVVSRLGEASENGLGLLNVDTKIFVSDTKLQEEEEDEVLSTSVTRTELTRMGARLYEANDKEIKYLEDMTKIITPILELYLRCQVGAAKKPAS